MTYEYDTWNRTKEITYADGEVVTYTYNPSGQLTNMDGEKGNNLYSYVNGIQYDKFGSCISKYYKNGIETTFQYEPYRRRLSKILGVYSANDTIQYVNYTYDKADNITVVNKSATRGVGGYPYTVNCEFAYDSLYRIVSSEGNINNNQYYYDYELSYSLSGSILTKDVTAFTLTTFGKRTVGYNNSYNYDLSQPHAVGDINGHSQDFAWDANGNMTYWYNDPDSYTESMYWDEENRLCINNDYMANLNYYLYDASGERTLKLYGNLTSMYINGQGWINLYNISNYSLYSSPYCVMTPGYYTKHYYIEGDRVVSKIGGGLANSPYGISDHVYGFDIQDNNDYDAKNDSIEHMIKANCGELEVGAEVYFEPAIKYYVIFGQEQDDEEQFIYYYHKDHLGTSTQISDISGDIVHHMEYMPYGENFYEKRSSWGTDYKFNGKELDDETGFYYYGARYYMPEFSIWLSVDPLADKYPGISPYAYCLNNPVRLIDPNGKAAIKPPSAADYTQNNISEQGQLRFESILHNIESFADNENFMSAFSQTTGLNRSQIKEFLTYGKGPSITLDFGSDIRTNNASNFLLGADIINYLGGINANDQNKLGTQAFGVAMVLIDELSHCGDMKFNEKFTSTGQVFNNPGKQRWNLSPFFHRGGDSQIFGFGVETKTYSTTETIRGKTIFSGEISVLSPFTPLYNKNYPNMPLIPKYDMNKNISIGLKLLE